MSTQAPSLLVFGAHPDDCESKASGLAALFARRGGRVCFVSVTNGDAGHHVLGGAQLARIRREEARAAAEALGIESLVLDNHDGELLPSLENRRQIIGIIRDFQPDLILTPRPNDYHPDHRYTSVLVQDAAYMVTVPNIVAHVEHLRTNPLIMYCSDHFQKPYPFSPDVAVDIGEVIEQKIEALHSHSSQFYEWLPYNGRYLDSVPSSPEERRSWFRERMLPRLRTTADQYRPLLIERYGQERGAEIEFAEAFETCEYGSPLTAELRERLFTF
jgi:N-acetylglucosamine malate deacetylase 1